MSRSVKTSPILLKEIARTLISFSDRLEKTHSENGNPFRGLSLLNFLEKTVSNSLNVESPTLHSSTPASTSASTPPSTPITQKTFSQDATHSPHVSSHKSKYRPALKNQAVIEALLKLRKNLPPSPKPPIIQKDLKKELPRFHFGTTPVLSPKAKKNLAINKRLDGTPIFTSKRR